MKNIALFGLCIPLLLASCDLLDKPEGKDKNKDKDKPAVIVRHADFAAYDAGGVVGTRVGKSGQFSLDAEPEYITVSADSKTAYVSLQESNALAVVDIAGGKVTAVHPLGLKDWSAAGGTAGFDASNKDSADGEGAINIQNWPVYGAYMPDAIASLSIGGETYIFTANEGDGREYGGFEDEARVEDLELDPTAFPNAAELQEKSALGRLKVSTVDGDLDGDGDYDRLVAFGGRSMSVWNAAGELVADTGSLFEQVTAQQIPTAFNSEGTADGFDDRSDDKGPEPEAIATAQIGGQSFAFVGLERVGGIMALNVSDPAEPTLVEYENDIALAADPESGAAGDLGPEGLLFIPAADSPNGANLLVSSNEVSGSIGVYEVAADGSISRVGRYQADPFVFDESVAEISAYDAGSKRLFTVNGATGGLDILDISDVTAPKLVGSVDLSDYGAGANSVAVHGGVVAVAVQAEEATENGVVALLDVGGEALAEAVAVGALPDMLTFTPDGAHLLVANEGEPNDDYSVDPAGSVSIIDVAAALAAEEK